MNDVDLYRKLPPEIRRMVDHGEITLGTLKKMISARQNQRRHEEHADHTVDEWIETSIDIYFFE